MKKKKKLPDIPAKLRYTSDNGLFGMAVEVMKDNPKLTKKFLQSLKEENKKSKEIFIQKCIESGLFTQKYYEKKLKSKYISEDGLDSLTDLMRAYLSEPYFSEDFDGDDEPIKKFFMTTNKKVLRDRKMLNKLFDVEILSPEQAMKKIDKLMEQERKEKENFEKMTGMKLIADKYVAE